MTDIMMLLTACVQVGDRKNFVTFLGETKKLATAQFHGNCIDIWPPPSSAHLVMKPESCIPLAGKVLWYVLHINHINCI